MIGEPALLGVAEVHQVLAGRHQLGLGRRVGLVLQEMFGGLLAVNLHRCFLRVDDGHANRGGNGDCERQGQGQGLDDGTHGILLVSGPVLRPDRRVTGNNLARYRWSHRWRNRLNSRYGRLGLRMGKTTGRGKGKGKGEGEGEGVDGSNCPSLRIRLLGVLRVDRDGDRLDLPPSKKTRALLAYLAATGRPHTRDQLCALLWDGPDDPRAQLRWSLTKVRPLVEGTKVQRLVADGEHV